MSDEVEVCAIVQKVNQSSHGQTICTVPQAAKTQDGGIMVRMSAIGDFKPMEFVDEFRKMTSKWTPTSLTTSSHGISNGTGANISFVALPKAETTTTTTTCVALPQSPLKKTSKCRAFGVYLLELLYFIGAYELLARRQAIFVYQGEPLPEKYVWPILVMILCVIRIVFMPFRHRDSRFFFPLIHPEVLCPMAFAIAYLWLRLSSHLRPVEMVAVPILNVVMHMFLSCVKKKTPTTKDKTN